MPESAAAIPWIMEPFRKGCPMDAHPLKVLQAGVASVPILIDHLSHEESFVRSRAVYDLGELGPVPARPSHRCWPPLMTTRRKFARWLRGLSSGSAYPHTAALTLALDDGGRRDPRS